MVTPSSKPNVGHMSVKSGKGVSDRDRNKCLSRRDIKCQFYFNTVSLGPLFPPSYKTTTGNKKDENKQPIVPLPKSYHYE